MDEYTFESLIINPETPGLEDLIGKEVYFNDVPIYCIKQANENYQVGILRDVRKDYSAPFFVETSSGCMLNYACIIPKKEESKPEYFEFKSQEEFLNHYAYHRDKLVESSLNHQLSSFGGVWLKRKGTNVLYMVIEIWDDGVVLGDAKMKTIRPGYKEYITMNTATLWKELCEKYTFLDGSPCGKLTESK